jgi:hypothetical protein
MMIYDIYSHPPLFFPLSPINKKPVEVIFSAEKIFTDLKKRDSVYVVLKTYQKGFHVFN